MASTDEYKKQSAADAAKRVESGMTIGLGTGSTAAHLIALLGERAKAGLRIKAVPTSEDTRRKAESAGLALIEPDETTVIDLAIDGADEIDGRGDLIKGGGGALLREKIIAHAARRFIVIADASKRVAQLGAFPLPVEVARFAYGATVRVLREKLSSLGMAPNLVLRFKSGAPFVTDGGNYIVDCALGRIPDATALDRALKEIPGVIETGLFAGLADEAILAGPAGVERLVFAPRAP
jgi:ribose 5-phosphate isomerase A